MEHNVFFVAPAGPRTAEMCFVPTPITRRDASHHLVESLGHVEAHEHPSFDEHAARSLDGVVFVGDFDANRLIGNLASEEKGCLVGVIANFVRVFAANFETERAVSA